MSPETLIQTPGSLVAVVDEVVGLAQEVADRLEGEERLSVHRWKPPRVPDPLPAIWHWLTEPPPPEQRDLNRIRDFVTISAYIGMRHSDQDADLAQLERYCDVYRDAVDALLWRPEPGGAMNGTATWAKRSGMRLVAVEFGGVELIAFEFPLQFSLDRQLKHN